MAIAPTAPKFQERLKARIVTAGPDDDKDLRAYIRVHYPTEAERNIEHIGSTLRDNESFILAYAPRGFNFVVLDNHPATVILAPIGYSEKKD